MREYDEAIELLQRENKVAETPRKSNPIEMLPDMPTYRIDLGQCSLKHEYSKIVTLTDVHYTQLLYSVQKSWEEFKDALDAFNSSLAETLEAAREMEIEDDTVDTPGIDLVGGDLDAGVAIIESEVEEEEEVEEDGEDEEDEENSERHTNCVS